jgi:hypothetical protein
MLLPSRCTYHSALRNKCLIALSGKFHIVLRRFPGPFLKCMEHIDRFRKLGDVAYAMFHLGMNSDLTDAGTNARHRFPVQWLQPLLNQPKLKARESPGIPRECLQVTPRGPEPQDRLFGYDVNMQVLVYSCQERRTFREHRTNMGVLPTFLIVRPRRARRTVLGASTYIYKWCFRACSYLPLRGGLDLSFTARVERAHSDRARSASTRDRPDRPISLSTQGCLRPSRTLPEERGIRRSLAGKEGWN